MLGMIPHGTDSRDQAWSRQVRVWPCGFSVCADHHTVHGGRVRLSLHLVPRTKTVFAHEVVERDARQSCHPRTGADVAMVAREQVL